MRKSFWMGLGVLAAANLAFAQSSSVSGGETAAKVEDVKPADKKWSASIFQETGVKQTAIGNDTVSEKIATDLSVGLGYKLDEEQSLSLAQWGAINQTNKRKKGEVAATNFMIKHAHKKAIEVAGRSLASDLRFYLPVGDYHTKVGRYEARAGLSLEDTIAANTTVEYSSSLRGYSYSKDNDGQNSMRAYLGAQVNYEVNKYVTPFAYLNYEGRWYHTGQGYGLDVKADKEDPADNRDTALIAVGANFNVEPVSIGAYMEQGEDLRAAGFNLFESNDTTYYLNMTASM